MIYFFNREWLLTEKQQQQKIIAEYGNGLFLRSKDKSIVIFAKDN